MLKPKSPQESFYGSYLYDRIVPVDHLLRKIDVPPENDTSYNLVKRGINGKERVHTGTDYQQAPRGGITA